MKITKKMKKKINGMNYQTKSNFEDGFKPETFKNIAPKFEPAVFKKVKGGTPYVNPLNFI